MVVSALLPILALGLLAASLLVLGRRKPQYSHVIHTISELGEVGAPDQKLVAWAVFLPIGLLLLPISYLYLRSFPPAASLAGCISVGYLVAAFFPCDSGAPVSGSTRQGIHNLGGAVEYIGGGFSLLSAAERLGDEWKWLGFIVLGVAVALTVLPTVSVRGLVQRVGEVCLFGGLAYLVWLAAGGDFEELKMALCAM